MYICIDVFVTIAMKIIFNYQPCFDTLILVVQMDVSPKIDVINKQHCSKIPTIEMEKEVLARVTKSRPSGARYLTFSGLSILSSFSCTLFSSRLMKWFNQVVDPTCDVIRSDLMLKTQRIQIPPCVGSKREDCVFHCSRKETGRIIFYVFFCCCKLELFLIFFFSVQGSSFQIHFFLFVLIWDRLKGWTDPLIRAVRLKIQTLMISLHQIQYDVKL